MTKTKCIVRQDWTTYEADTWTMIDRRSFVYVTNEDGTPHIYDSIKEARAEIVANYGEEPNSRGILSNHTKDDSGNDHWSIVTIVREGTDEYTKATGTEPEQATGKTYTIICTTKANRTEYLHAVTVEAANVTEAKKNAAAVISDTLDRHAFAPANIDTKPAQHLTNWCADRWNISAAEVIEAAKSPQGIDIYGANPAQIVNEAMSEATEATDAAREAERKATDAAINYDPETAAAFVAEARRAADKTEAAELKDTDAYAHDAKTYANSTAWTLDRMTKDHPETAAELAHFARVCADAAHEAADNAVASYEYARRTCYADYQTSAYAARAFEIRAEQRDDARKEARRAEETAQKVEALATVEDQQQREHYAAEAIAYRWSAEETRATIEYYAAIAAANAAARSFLAALEDATGHQPYDMDAAAVHRVARDELTGTSDRATAADRETVDAMVQVIAAEPEPAPVYQRHELEAFLGEPEDYDVEAIEAEATEYRDGARVWVVFGDDLAAIAERYQTAEYIPA